MSIQKLMAVLLLASLLPLPALAADDLTGHAFPFAAYEKIDKQIVDADGSRIEVAFGPGELKLDRGKILDWIRVSARAIVTYYGRFPVKSLKLLVVARAGDKVMFGQAFGEDDAAIRVYLGTMADEKALKDDWILVHEMVHLAFPRLAERHNWLSEGLAVYVESIARVQSGDLSEEEIWSGFLRGIPRGLPQAGDRGLDNTPTWGRTYWGGALFCMLADIEIRKRTGNRMGLQQALRGVLAQTNFSAFWPIGKALEAGDEAIGGEELMRLYQRLKDTPEPTDLDALWSELGVAAQGRTVVLDPKAPAAAIRSAIVRRG